MMSKHYKKQIEIIEEYLEDLDVYTESEEYILNELRESKDQGALAYALETINFNY